MRFTMVIALNKENLELGKVLGKPNYKDNQDAGEPRAKPTKSDNNKVSVHFWDDCIAGQFIIHRRKKRKARRAVGY